MYSCYLFDMFELQYEIEIEKPNKKQTFVNSNQLNEINRHV